MIAGFVTDQNGNKIENASVELKDGSFITQRQVYTDSEGYFCFEAENAVYPFMTAVRDYAENYLEYWSQNIDASADLRLNVCIDKLEVYGLHVFRVKGGLDALMAYFRPMSLVKFQNGETDICPEIQGIQVTIDEKPAEILTQNMAKESIGEQVTGACLIQFTTKDGIPPDWRKIEIAITDTEGHSGMASIFRS